MAVALTSNAVSFIGTAGNDFLSNPGAADDSISGLAGHDTLLGFGGVDQLSGGEGNDSLDGGDLADILQGDAGNDTLFGGNGPDILWADGPTGTGKDSGAAGNLLRGNAGEDVLSGGLGRDTLEGGDGKDVLNGGGGADWLLGGNDADLFLLDLSINPSLTSNFLNADTIADFSQTQGDALSFGLSNGVLQGSLAPAPLIWRGSLQTSNGPLIGLALPGAELGLGYLQAWFIPAASGDTVAGGWIVIDLDQNAALDSSDILIRLVSVTFSSTDFYSMSAAGSFAGMAGSADDDALTAVTSGARLFGLGGADLLMGSTAGDWLSGGAGADSIAGLAGDDQLWGGAGDDWIYGGAGHDAIYAEGPTMDDMDDMDDAEATNFLDGETGNDSLFGGSGLDQLIGGDGLDFLFGAGGTDTLEGGAGNDWLMGGDGADSLIGEDGADTLEGGGGDDWLILQDASDWLDGGDGFDWLFLSFGLLIHLGLAENQVNSGSRIIGFEAVDARASSSATTMIGGPEGNYLFGGAAGDCLMGSDGDDYLKGSAGNDTLAGGIGQNVLEGGAGNDFYQIDSIDDLALEYPSEGADTISSGIDFYLPIDFETLILSSGGTAQRGFGNEGNNLLIGNALTNELFGGTGNDTILGEGGDDTLQGGAGNDRLIGGDGGQDWVSYADLSEFGQHVTVNISSSVTSGAAGNDQLQGFEHVLAGAGDDQLYGNDGANYLSAGAGADWLRGEAGADTLDGGEHDDTVLGGVEGDWLLGGAGRDSITGDSGNDTLHDSGGADSMAGGSGNDLYIFTDPEGLITEGAGAGQDTIITACDIIVPPDIEVLVIAEGVSDLFLVAGSRGTVMIGNGLSHNFQGSAGDDMILASGGSLADILALFASWP